MLFVCDLIYLALPTRNSLLVQSKAFVYSMSGFPKELAPHHYSKIRMSAFKEGIL